MRFAAPLLAAIALWNVSTRAADTPAWEVWDDCQFEAEKYFDGDSFHVTHAGESVILRLYFVDAPESEDDYRSRIDEQAAYFRVSNTAVLKAGTAAKEFAGNFLSKPFRVITSRRVAPGASRTDRYYAVIERGETRLDAALLEEGLARATSEVAAYPDDASGKRAMQQLRVLEQNSEKAKRGIWAASGTRVEAIVNAVKSRLGKAIDHRTNVNTATATELASLPGVGPKMAAQIIHARPLKDLSALDALPGFGPKKIEALRELVSF